VRQANTTLAANNVKSRDTSLETYETFTQGAASFAALNTATKFKAAAAGSLPGSPYMGIPLNRESTNMVKGRTPAEKDLYDGDKQHHDSIKAMGFVTKAFENMSVLKNIIAAFVAIGDRFGGQDIRKKTHMSPVQIYNALIEYMTVGSFTFVSPNGTAHDQLNVQMRQSGTPGIRFAANDMFKNGVDTDEMFIFVIKAMVAKILTVIGVYNMINRPIDRNALGYASATRWTLGGSDALPKVIPEALELYVRLPLLAEFYRETFKFDASTPVLSMVPHMDGTFQGIVELIFDRAKHIQYGTYSETDVKTMIEEINKIYMTYKGSKSMVMDVMQEFVAEINRRYGILLTDERDRYKKMDTDRYEVMYSTPRDAQYDDRVDYDILPEELGSGIGPSDSFVTEGSKVSGPLSTDHKWALRTGVHQKFIRELRMKMDNSFNAIWDNDKASADGLENLKTLSFENLVKSRKEEMKYARSAKEQFRIVQQAINGLGEFSMNAQERSLILFHETVVTGLNTVMSLYTMVKAFHTKMWKMANSVDNVEAHFSAANHAKPFEILTGILVAAGAHANKEGDAAYFAADESPAANAIPVGNQSTPVAVDIGQRAALDHDQLAQDFIETLYGHCSSLDGLVELQMEVVDHPDCSTWLKDKDLSAADRPKSIAISVDHSKLYELVERELSFVKHALDKFRGLIPKAIHEKYESSNQMGSVYYLEKHFVHELLAGKVTGWTSDNLANTNTKVRSVMNYLNKPWKVSNANANLTAVAPFHDQFDRSATLLNLCSVGRGVARRQPQLNLQLLEVANPPTTGVFQVHGNFFNPSDLTDGAQKGVVSLFNRLTANYLNMCYDGQSQKIYVNTINNFANGAFSDAVMKNNSLDDTGVGGIAQNTADTHVLARSLATLMKNLLVAKYPQKTFKHYLETDLAEIPMFIKENYRVNMPVYSKLFALLIKRCEMLKNFSNAGTDSNRIANISRLNSVIAGSQSLMGCMRDVLEEVSDTPVYLETHKDSIKEYESLNGMKPMMPLSSILYFVQNGSTALPTNNNKNVEKMLYGTRGILNSGEYSLAKFPGMRDILQKHNETSESEYHLDEKSLGNHVSDSMLALRHVINAKHYLSYMMSNPALSHVGVDLVEVFPSNPALPDAIKLETAAYSVGSGNLARPLAAILQLTESSKQRESRRVLVETVEKTDKTIIRGSREQIRMMNIIDMNIVPINVHALMREMPLVNLFNYSYTFDSMVCNMMGLGNEYMTPDYADDGSVPAGGHMSFARHLQATPIREKAKKFMGYMLLHPYAEVPNDQFHDSFGRIVRGSTGIAGLGRPKFLGDELYNKALFGEIYTNEKYWDESGPNAGEAAGSGRSLAKRTEVAESMMTAKLLAAGTDVTDAGIAALVVALGNPPGADLRLKRLRNDLSRRVAVNDLSASLVTDTLVANSIGFTVAAGNNVAWWTALKAAVNAEVTRKYGDSQNDLPLGNSPTDPKRKFLHYLHPTKDGRGEIVAVNVGDHKGTLQSIGKERFDTFYCRSLVWLTNIQRVLRLKLRQDLEWYDSRIVKDNAVTSADITEQYGNDAHSYSSRHYSN
jgi:hypothetical protein